MVSGTPSVLGARAAEAAAPQNEALAGAYGRPAATSGTDVAGLLTEISAKLDVLIDLAKPSAILCNAAIERERSAAQPAQEPVADPKD